MRLGVLVSGRGSNLEAILDAGLDVALVVSNRPGVRALEVAATHGVATRLLRRADFGDASARDTAVGSALTGAGVELAVLAGWDQLLRPSYFAAFGGRTINIHPSLLPAHGGPGMVGLEVHRSVLRSGEMETGVTIHEVTAGPRRGTDPGAGSRAGAARRRRRNACRARARRGASAAGVDAASHRSLSGRIAAPARPASDRTAARASGHDAC